jgi:hypothetical protein
MTTNLSIIQKATNQKLSKALIDILIYLTVLNCLFIIPTWYDASDGAWHSTEFCYPSASESIEATDDSDAVSWRAFVWFEMIFAMAKLREERKMLSMYSKGINE